MSEIPASLIGKRVTVRLRDGGGYRDIVGFLQSQSSLLNRHDVLIDFSDEEVAVWREIEPLPNLAGKGAPYSLRIAELEELSHLTWPAHEIEESSGWIYRRSGGVTWRANSVLPVGKPPFGEAENSIDEELAKVIAYYKASGLEPAFTIPLPTYAELDAHLESKGWSVVIKAKYFVKNAANLKSSKINFDVEALPSNKWLACQGDGKIQGILEAYPAKYISYSENEVVIATARVAVLGSWSLITRVFVDEVHRGKGLGAEIMFKAEEVSKQLGAEKIALQVDATNEAALKLYEKLEYQIHHEYVYRVLR